MVNQTAYPRVYQFSPLKKLQLAVGHLMVCALGFFTAATSYGLIAHTGLLGGVTLMFTLLTLFWCTGYLSLMPRVALWIRIVFGLAVIGLWAATGILANDLSHIPKGLWVPELAGLLLVSVNLFFLLRSLRGRLVLHADRLDCRGIFFSRTMCYSEIVDSSVASGPIWQNLLRLDLRDGTRLDIGTFVRPDEVFRAWVDGLPNKRLQAKQRQWEDQQANPAFPRVYRQGRLGRAVVSLLALMVCALGCAILAMAGDLVADPGLNLLLRQMDEVPIFALMAFVLIALNEPRLGIPVRIILALVFSGLSYAYSSISSPHMLPIPPSDLGWVKPTIGAVFLAAGPFYIYLTHRTQLTLYADRVEYRGILATRTIRNSEIADTFGFLDTFFGSICLRLNNGRSVRIVKPGPFDAPFSDWINSFPNRDREAEDRNREAWERKRQDFLANSPFGNAPEGRVYNFRAHTQALKWLWVPALLISAVGIYGRPYPLCVFAVMAMPVVAVIMVALSHSRWVLHNDKTVYRVGIGAQMAVAPSIVLALRTFFDVRVFDWTVPAVCSVAAALGMILVVCLIERRYRWPVLLSALPIYMCYAWGSLMFLNVMLDTSRHEVFPVKVLKVEANTDNLVKTLTRPAGQPGGETLAVYLLVRPWRQGDTVCLAVHKGALSWSWYHPIRCPAA